MAVGLARLEAQGQSLGKVSPQRFKFMIGQAVGQFYLANRWSRHRHPSAQRAEGRWLFDVLPGDRAGEDTGPPSRRVWRPP